MRRVMLLGVNGALVAGLALAGCETMHMYISEQAKPPAVTLERVEVASIQPYYMAPRIGFKDCSRPGRIGKKCYSSTLNLDYILNIHNPNPYSIRLDEISFGTAFEGFDVKRATVSPNQWIPARKTNQLSVMVTYEAFDTVVSLTFGSESMLLAKRIPAKELALVKKWWEGMGELSFPIDVKNGVAIFQRPDGKILRTAFKGSQYGFVKRVRIDGISMDYSDPKEPKCVLVFVLREISNLKIKIYRIQDLHTPVLERTYDSEPSGDPRLIKIPFSMPKGTYHLVIRASNVEGEPKSVIDRRFFDVE